MPCYRIFDRVLASDIALPELPPAPEARADLVFRAAGAHPAEFANWVHFHDWLLPGGDVSIRGFRDGGRFRLAFPGGVDFVVDAEAGVITLAAGAEDTATIRHLLLDQVLPRVLGHQGRLVVHAAGVVLEDGRCIALLGETGAGKSTLAAALARAGARVLSDDCLLIEVTDGRIRCLPAYPGLRLWPDSLEAVLPQGVETTPMAEYAGKRRVVAAGECERNSQQWHDLSVILLLEKETAGHEAHLEGSADTPIARECGLLPGSASDASIARGCGLLHSSPAGAGSYKKSGAMAQPVGASTRSRSGSSASESAATIEPAGGQQALMALIGSLFTLDVPGKAQAAATFEGAGRVLSSGLPAWRLCYPRQFDMLPEVCAAIRRVTPRASAGG